MAVYMQGSRRRWVTVAIGAVALLIGVGIGYLIGRGTATTADDVVAESRSKAEERRQHCSACPSSTSRP